MKKVEIKYQIPGFVIIIVVLLLAYKVGLPYFQDFRLQLKIQDLIDWDKILSREPPLDELDMKEQILFRAAQLNLPISSDNVKVTIDNNDYTVIIEYVYPVDLYITKFALKFYSQKRTES